MKIILIFPVLWMLFLLAQTDLACSCRRDFGGGKTARQIVDEARQSAQAVFSGEVVKITLSGKMRNGEFATAQVYFRVFKSWKGNISSRAIVFTAHVCCICGFPFKVGGKYLVYADGDESLSTNICTRTGELADAGEDVENLGAPEKTFAAPKKIKRGRTQKLNKNLAGRRTGLFRLRFAPKSPFLN